MNNSVPDQPQTVYTGTCPVCEREGKLVVKPRTDGSRGWWVHCRSATCEADSSEWLHKVVELVSAPGGYALLQDPPKWLADYLEEEAHANSEPPAPLPSMASIDGRASRLLTVPEAMDYLIKRGLTEDTIEEYKLGWDSEPPAFTFPIINAQEMLINWIRRPWPSLPDGPPYIARKGRNMHNEGVQLYPNVPPEGPLLIVEGLFDAILGRQEGLPTVTSTHGVGTFLDEWLPLFKRRRVAVMYDVGAEKVMDKHVAALRTAGAEAWQVRLSRLLRRGGGKDLSDALTGGYTKQDIKDLINSERRRARS